MKKKKTDKRKRRTDEVLYNTKPLPKWVMRKYATLWRHFQQRRFDYSEANRIVDENTSVIISFLRKNRWIEIGLNPEDSRKRVYMLKSPSQAIGEMA